MLAVTTSGRRSGQLRTTTVGYVPHGQGYAVASGAVDYAALMAQPGPVRYARVGAGGRVAYRVVGVRGPAVVYIGGSASHQDVLWEEPGYRRLHGGLGDFARVVTMDRRGTGLSDSLPPDPTIEDHVADVIAVLDAEGLPRAALYAVSDGARIAVAVAARYPGRVDRLALFSPSVGSLHLEPATLAAIKTLIEETWGDGRLLQMWAPSRANDERWADWAARYERASASPSQAAALYELGTRIDVTPELASVRAPTLVLHRSDDALTPIEFGRAMAKGIQGATFVELPGTDSLAFTEDVDTVFEHLAGFLVGRVSSVRQRRALLTILFVDIVGSTARSAQLGDEKWTSLLGEWEQIAMRAISNESGSWIKSTGDGAVATFDSPDAALTAAASLRDASATLSLEVRTGVHTGQCERHDGDVRGIGVHVAARIGALAGDGEILVSPTVRDLVLGSDHTFVERGEHELRGVPGSWRLFALDS